jgi:hypothetical protein
MPKKLSAATAFERDCSTANRLKSGQPKRFLHLAWLFLRETRASSDAIKGGISTEGLVVSSNHYAAGVSEVGLCWNHERRELSLPALLSP